MGNFFSSLSRLFRQDFVKSPMEPFINEYKIEKCYECDDPTI
jgi:hypothetical protein